MEYINEKALEDSESTLKYALLFTSRYFDALAMNDLKVRSKLISLLQGNYKKAKQWQKEDRQKLYNSLALLGECFHRIRTSQNEHIHVLGKSLLNLLVEIINEDNFIDFKCARVILTQITLNGSIFKSNHAEEIEELLFNVRRIIVEKPDLCATTKALLLMALDLHNNSISNINKKVVDMYTEYLKKADAPPEKETIKEIEQSPPKMPTKKWSELVEEELNELNDYDEDNEGSRLSSPQNSYSTSSSPQKDQFKRPPLYNLDNFQQKSYRNRTESENSENDRQSVRSEDGSLKIYNVRDKHRHNQNRNNNGRYNQHRRFENDSGFKSEDFSRNNHRSDENQRDRRDNNHRRSTYEVPPRFQKKMAQNQHDDRQSFSHSETRRDTNGDRPSSLTKKHSNNHHRGNYYGHDTRRSVSSSNLSDR